MDTGKGAQIINEWLGEFSDMEYPQVTTTWMKSGTLPAAWRAPGPSVSSTSPKLCVFSPLAAEIVQPVPELDAAGACTRALLHLALSMLFVRPMHDIAGSSHSFSWLHTIPLCEGTNLFIDYYR